MSYVNDRVEGFVVGISAPVNGTNTIDGGQFNDVRNIDVSTANDRAGSSTSSATSSSLTR